jgi:hypothetical protein
MRDRNLYREAAVRVGLTVADGDAYFDWSERINPESDSCHVTPTGDGLRIERESVRVAELRRKYFSALGDYTNIWARGEQGARSLGHSSELAKARRRLRLARKAIEDADVSIT